MEKMLSWIAILLACVAAASAAMGTPNLKECKRPIQSKTPNLVMQVSDCDDPERCYLIRNTTHTVQFTFSVTEATRGLKMWVYGQVMRVRVPYVRNADLCKTTVATDGTKCEGNGLVPGKTYVTTYEFYIRSRFPEWFVPVEFELMDGTKKLSCTSVDVKIQCNVQTEKACKA